MARGWIKDRFHNYAPPVLTVAAEDSDTIDVTLSLVDQEGNAINESRTFIAELLGEDGILQLAAAFTLAETGAGTEISTTAQSTLIFSTSATGQATLTVEDIDTDSGLTLFLVVRPLDTRGPGAYTTVTFD